MEMSIWSLFAGIGGLEKGLEDAGLGHTTLQVEIEPYAQSILAKHWPDVPRIDDVRKVTLDNDKIAGKIVRPDLICGGFPCQPVSLAGKGLAQDDDRWLWPEFERIIETFWPRYVIAENVPGLRKRGLADVLRGLSRLGFDAEWIRLSAAAVGAPHLRERLFIVAYASGAGRSEDTGGTHANEAADARRSTQEDHQPDRDAQGHRAGTGTRPSVPDPDAYPSRLGAVTEPDGGSEGREQASLGSDTDGLRADLAQPQPRVFTHAVRERLPIAAAATGWESEPDICRVAYGLPARVDRLKALGNAVVPQCAEFVGTALKEAIEDGRV